MPVIQFSWKICSPIPSLFLAKFRHHFVRRSFSGSKEGEKDEKTRDSKEKERETCLFSWKSSQRVSCMCVSANNTSSWYAALSYFLMQSLTATTWSRIRVTIVVFITSVATKASQRNDWSSNLLPIIWVHRKLHDPSSFVVTLLRDLSAYHYLNSIYWKTPPVQRTLTSLYLSLQDARALQPLLLHSHNYLPS